MSFCCETLKSGFNCNIIRIVFNYGLFSRASGKEVEASEVGGDSEDEGNEAMQLMK